MTRYSRWFLFKRLNFNTLYFSFKFLPFRQALKIPVFIHKKVLLRDLSGKVFIPCSAHSGDIWIGYGDVGIFDIQNSRTILEIKGTIFFEGTAYIGQGSRVSVGRNGVLKIGTNFKITAESCIICMYKIDIAADVLISWQVQIMDTDFHIIRNGNQKVMNADAPVYIGSKVWLGTRCNILKGANVPSGSIVAACAVVTKKLPEENAIYAGQPAILVRRDIYWKP